MQTRRSGQVTQEMLERDIAKAKKAKAEHAGEKSKSRRRIPWNRISLLSRKANLSGSDR
jgi:hypothetical protein